MLKSNRIISFKVLFIVPLLEFQRIHLRFLKNFFTIYFFDQTFDRSSWKIPINTIRTWVGNVDGIRILQEFEFWQELYRNSNKKSRWLQLIIVKYSDGWVYWSLFVCQIRFMQSSIAIWGNYSWHCYRVTKLDMRHLVLQKFPEKCLRIFIIFCEKN